MSVIKAGVAFFLLSVLILVGSVYYTNQERTFIPKLEREPTVLRFTEYQDYRAYESIRMMLEEDGTVPKGSIFKPYEKGIATYKGDGVWDFRFWVDLPDGTRQVFFNDYLEGDNHQWTKIVQ